MNTYLIEPLAPLVIRSGRPFSGQSQLDGGNFPLPGSLAGALRTTWADQHEADFNAELLKNPVHGPLLCQRDSQGQLTPLLPRPADVVYVGQENGPPLPMRLQPQALPADSGCDLPDGLLPVYGPKHAGKPEKGPAWWTFAQHLSWMQGQTPGDLNPHTLPDDPRVHVGLATQTQAADPGRLYKSLGLDFAKQRFNAEKQSAQADNAPWSDSDYLLLARCPLALKPDHLRLGGEGRLSRLNLGPAPLWPEMPDGLIENIQQQGGLRLTLLTPAIFTQGYRPGWARLNHQTQPDTPPSHGLAAALAQLTLRAVAIDRWQAISGWDLAGGQSAQEALGQVQNAVGKPRATRKAASAGSVYWFSLPADISRESIADLCTALWLQNIADHAQDRNDGYGLALIAPWQAPNNSSGA